MRKCDQPCGGSSAEIPHLSNSDFPDSLESKDCSESSVKSCTGLTVSTGSSESKCPGLWSQEYSVAAGKRQWLDSAGCLNYSHRKYRFE